MRGDGRFSQRWSHLTTLLTTTVKYHLTTALLTTFYSIHSLLKPYKVAYDDNFKRFTCIIIII